MKGGSYAGWSSATSCSNISDVNQKYLINIIITIDENRFNNNC